MSDYDDFNEGELTPEDVMKLVILNKKRNTIVDIEIKDKDGAIVALPEMVQNIVEYVKDKYQDTKENEINEQLIPLVSQSLVSGLSRIMGLHCTAFLLNNDLTKMSLINMMVVSILLLKFIQENDLTIYTNEREVSAEEAEMITNKAKEQSMDGMGDVLGMSPKDLMKEMISQGMLSKKEISELLSEDEGNGKYKN